MRIMYFIHLVYSLIKTSEKYLVSLNAGNAVRQKEIQYLYT